MHDIKLIRENPVAFDAAMARRGRVAESPCLLELDEKRRRLVTEIQSRQERRNSASKDIGKAMAQKDMALADSLKAEVSALKDQMVALEAEERTVTAELDLLLASIPNVPHDDVPDGKDEHDNVELRLVGEKPRMNFKPKEHFELGEALGMMDFEKAAQISGSRFTILKGQLARLERALGQFMLDLHTDEHGYEEHVVPLLVRDEALFGTNQLPKFEEDLFFTDPRNANWLQNAIELAKNAWRSRLGKGPDSITRTEVEGIVASATEATANLIGLVAADAETEWLDENGKIRGVNRNRLGLIPTSEVPLTNLVREEILDQSALPMRFTALTPCFRSEAGSAGRDTRGMLRQHQFYKVELVSITDAETSLAEHDRMTACAEEVLKRLGLHFRTVVLCTGDMGFGAKKTHDIEVWLPGQNAYREISSCSVCGDFQARRMNARYRAEGEKQTKFVHTLNGSGVAVGRALIAVMENYQNDDGTITVPEVLRPYMGGLELIGTPA
jgi:seryl-tRNA synthetase